VRVEYHRPLGLVKADDLVQPLLGREPDKAEAAHGDPAILARDLDMLEHLW
jgi:hypothetical protein